MTGFDEMLSRPFREGNHIRAAHAKGEPADAPRALAEHGHAGIGHAALPLILTWAVALIVGIGLFAIAGIFQPQPDFLP